MSYPLRAIGDGAGGGSNYTVLANVTLLAGFSAKAHNSLELCASRCACQHNLRGDEQGYRRRDSLDAPPCAKAETAAVAAVLLTLTVLAGMQTIVASFAWW